MKQVYLLHGKGGSPKGTVSKLEPLLHDAHPEFIYHRLLLPHHDPNAPAENSVRYLQEFSFPPGSWLIGISLGGLVAAKLQKAGRADLRVVAISSPTWADGVRLLDKPATRIAIYSSQDDVIAGRTADWPNLAEAYDLPWLTHDTDAHKARLCRLLNWWLEGKPLAAAAQSV